MSAGRVPGHGLERGRRVEIVIDGRPAEAYEGESVAAAVMADRGLGLRRTENKDARGYYCGMGVCFDCVMVVDGVPQTRTCVTFVREGMTVAHQEGAEPTAASDPARGH
ncbi:(2Fe-2S)-binding protein [Microbacterium sp. Marseille-Q6648]|uniref:(2Fe-2S)-binding protein n=1 Tax=Microbacterium sp. Marseille-Q6648 TaxID=2937991 RepID=UPI00203AA008|nr:(2Fe-2S)-binding protein [Microbacterium sp. Marseille-Q6648]